MEIAGIPTQISAGRMDDSGLRQSILPEGLRILHVLDHSLPIHSGYSFRSRSIFREQHQRGWYTAHLTTPKHTEDGNSPETVDGLTFYRTPSVPTPIARIPVLAELELVRRVAREIVRVAAIERPHILHAHSPVLNALACQWAARQLKIPVVYEVRGFWEDAAVSHGTAIEGGTRYKAIHALETYALHHAAGVATICQGLRDDMLTRGIPPESITIIPNGVDIDAFPFARTSDTALRTSLDLDGRIVLGFLGSFYSYEGLDLLLAALPAIIRERSDVVLLLAGGGPEEEALKHQIQQLGIAHAVRYVGRVPNNQVQAYYDLVDICIYPRHPMRLTETVTPLKPLEAMAQGQIVLASDVGGHRELIEDGRTGWLFKAGDMADLVRKTLELIAARDTWPALRINGRRFVETERSWATTTAGYTQLYARALGRSASSV